ncbi:hypothetical protein GGS20DRAFT_587012 [Poronia punctata]|nr:hypothetical protein GGS20DRAFT_587012 [Poronia punctata]
MFVNVHLYTAAEVFSQIGEHPVGFTQKRRIGHGKAKWLFEIQSSLTANTTVELRAPLGQGNLGAYPAIGIGDY